MTDRLNALTVVLDRDIREDESKAIIDAIRMIKCVASVTPNVVDVESHVALMRVRNDLWPKISAIFWGESR